MHPDDVVDFSGDLDAQVANSEHAEAPCSESLTESSKSPKEPPRGPKDPPSGPPHTPPGHQPGHPGEHPGKPDVPIGPPTDPPGRGEPPPHRIKPQPVFGEPDLAWWLENPEMWDREQRMMTEYYPGWRSVDCHPKPGDPQAGPCKAWIGDITPLQPPSDAIGVVNALAADMSVMVHQSGRIDVDSECPPGKPSQLGVDERALRKTFSLVALQDGPPRHPRVSVMIPELPRPCRHTFRDGAVCPLLPSSGAWSWASNSLAEYLNHVSIWLVKFMVWDLTMKATGSGVWIGSEAAHDSVTLARTPVWAQCHCGSGLSFGRCCGRLQVSDNFGKCAQRPHAGKAALIGPMYRI